MPWTDDFAVLYRSFAEWAAVVWALIVSSADRPINVREAQCSASRGKLFGVTNLWQLGTAANTDKLTHRSLKPFPALRTALMLR
jgi:hypothetical protein